MKIKFGKTRLVFISRDCAFKIGRIRILRFFLHMVSIPFSVKRRKHFYGKYGRNISKAFIRDVFAGILANREEFAYWQKSHDGRVIPTTKQYLAGLIIIQNTAFEIDQEVLEEVNPLNIEFHDQDIPIETRESKQYGLYRSKVVLLDYGETATIKLLQKTS